MEFARMIRSSLRGPRYGFPTTAALLLAMTLTSTVTRPSRGQATDANTIFGVVTEARSGVANVTVCLCDRKYGLPVDRTTYLPIEWGKSQPDDSAERMALVQTDRKGRFEFTDVPNGEYRLIAQRWAGPFQGLFELHGTVIQLHGTADVTVPRPNEYYESQVALRAPGKAVLEFDQKAPNNSTFMFSQRAPS